MRYFAQGLWKCNKIDQWWWYNVESFYWFTQGTTIQNVQNSSGKAWKGFHLRLGERQWRESQRRLQPRRLRVQYLHNRDQCNLFERSLPLVQWILCLHLGFSLLLWIWKWGQDNDDRCPQQLHWWTHRHFSCCTSCSGCPRSSSTGQVRNYFYSNAAQLRPSKLKLGLKTITRAAFF